MRICLYTDTALPKMGGQELVVDALARQFLQFGHEPVVLAPFPRLPLLPRDRGLPYPVVRHPRFYSTRVLVDWYSWWLLRLFRRFPFDVLHCHGVFPPGYLAARIQNRIGVPIVLTSHGGDVRADSPRLRKALVRRGQSQAIQSVDALIAISRFTEDGFNRFGADPARILRIPNGVDLAPFEMRAQRPQNLDPTIKEREYVLFLGRLKRRKGVDLLLQALPNVPVQGSVELVIAGDGEERARLEGLAAALGLNDRVRFVGPIRGGAKVFLLQNALCTAMPSRGWEAFPLVVLESFAAGTPVLATRVSGLEDLIAPGRNGWLATPESPQSLAEALSTILLARPTAEALGRAAARDAADFSWSAVGLRHIELYQKMLNHRVCLSAR